MLQIRCKNNNVTKSFPEGSSLLDVYQEFANDIHLPYPVVSAKVNNVSQGLKFRLFQNRDVEFLDAREGSGHRVYVRSLSFVLYKATQDVFPGSKLFIEHSLSRGYYCNLKKKAPGSAVTDDDVNAIKAKKTEAAKHIADVIRQGKALNIPAFYWMTLIDGSDRSVPQWTIPELVEAMKTAYYE